MWYQPGRAEILPFIPADAHRILDAGCGDGRFDAILRHHRPDIELWGIDPLDGSDEVGTECFDRRLTGNYPADVPRDEQFDCIVLNDVLEHLVDPWAVLRETRGLLTPHGRIVVSIPNVRHVAVLRGLLHGRWDYADSGVLDRTHLRFFTRATAREMIESCGYAIESTAPIHVTDTGRLGALNRLTRGRLTDLLALQYVHAARLR